GNAVWTDCVAQAKVSAALRRVRPDGIGGMIPRPPDIDAGAPVGSGAGQGRSASTGSSTVIGPGSRFAQAKYGIATTVAGCSADDSAVHGRRGASEDRTVWTA